MRVFKRVILFLVMILIMSTPVQVSGISLLPSYHHTTLVSLPTAKIIRQQDGSHYVLMNSGYTIQNDHGFRLPLVLVFVDIPNGVSLLNFSISKQETIGYHEVNLPHFTTVQSLDSIPSALANFRTGDDFCTFTSIQKGKDLSKAVFVVKPCVYSPITQDLTIITSFQIDLTVSPIESHPHAIEVPVLNKYRHCIVARLDKMPLLMEYKHFLEMRGISTFLFPYEFASSFYGIKDQEKLRDALNSLYMKHGIESVFIIGNKEAVPMLDLAIFGINSKIEEVSPSDMFYADLSSNWDSNENGYFGEYGFDIVDYSYELQIGRLPFGNDNDIASYLNRLMSFFEENKGNRRKILTAGAWLSFKEEKWEHKDDEMYDIDGGQVVYTDYKNYFSNFQHKGLYEHQGIKISQVVNHGEELSYKNFISTMNAFDPLVVFLNGTGNRFEIKQKIWHEDKNNNKMVDYLEMSERSFVDQYTFRELTNLHQSVVFANASSAINPAVNFNLGSEFLKKNAVGFLGFTAKANYFFFHDNNPLNYELNTSMFGLFANIEYFFSKEYSLGESIKKGIMEYWEACNRYSQPELQAKQVQNIYALNLYGDPLLQLTSLPQVIEPVYQTQGSLQKGSKTYNIKDVYSTQDKNFVTLKCRIFEKMLTKDYHFTMLLDSDNNAGTGAPDTNGAEYRFDFGFDINQKFEFTGVHWSSTLYDWEEGPDGPVYNRFGFDYANTSVWIKIPRNLIIGSSFRFKIIFSNLSLQENSFFPGPDTYADYPSKQTYGPSQPNIEKLEIQSKMIRITLSPFQSGTYPVKGYELYRRINQESYQMISTGTASDLMVNDLNYIAEATLYYKVRSYDNQTPANYSPYSEEASITTPKDPNSPPPPKPEPEPPDTVKPPQPVVLTGEYNLGNKYVLLKWTKPIPGDFPIKQFDIHRGTSLDSIVYYQSITVDGLQFADSNVQSDKVYYYAIYVVDNQKPSHKSKVSNVLKIETASKPTPPPLPPPLLRLVS